MYKVKYAWGKPVKELKIMKFINSKHQGKHRNNKGMKGGKHKYRNMIKIELTKLAEKGPNILVITINYKLNILLQNYLKWVFLNPIYMTFTRDM